MQARFQTVAMNLQFMYYDYSKIMLAQLHTKCIFHDFFVSSISYRLTDLSLLKEFSKNISFSNSYILPSRSAVQKISMSTASIKEEGLIIVNRRNCVILDDPDILTNKMHLCLSEKEGFQSILQW